MPPSLLCDLTGTHNLANVESKVNENNLMHIFHASPKTTIDISNNINEL